MKRIFIIEREYGCGAGEVAEKVARRLQWRLFDRELTIEIAKLANVAPDECACHEECVDSWLYRLEKIFLRGSYEKILPVQEPEILDADRMLELAQQVVERVAEPGQCVIVGRGAPFFLRNRPDTFSTFLYAPRAWKIGRLEAQTGSRGKAEHLVDTMDQERAAFVKHYFGRTWPNRQLYHLMVNTIIGIDATVELLLENMDRVGRIDETRLDMD